MHFSYFLTFSMSPNPRNGAAVCADPQKNTAFSLCPWRGLPRLGDRLKSTKVWEIIESTTVCHLDEKFRFWDF